MNETINKSDNTDSLITRHIQDEFFSEDCAISSSKKGEILAINGAVWAVWVIFILIIFSSNSF